jgi:S-adenosylmethionine decarboxylase
MKIRQLFVDAYDCAGDLNDARAIEERLVNSACEIGATVRQTVTEKFQPHGITSVCILAESHLIVTTWPEINYAGIDVLLCNDSMDPQIVVDYICALLEPRKLSIQSITRDLDGRCLIVAE